MLEALLLAGGVMANEPIKLDGVCVNQVGVNAVSTTFKNQGALGAANAFYRMERQGLCTTVNVGQAMKATDSIVNQGHVLTLSSYEVGGRTFWLIRIRTGYSI